MSRETSLANLLKTPNKIHHHVLIKQKILEAVMKIKRKITSRVRPMAGDSAFPDP
jgi:hypothetical protein